MPITAAGTSERSQTQGGREDASMRKTAGAIHWRSYGRCGLGRSDNPRARVNGLLAREVATGRTAKDLGEHAMLASSN